MQLLQELFGGRKNNNNNNALTGGKKRKNNKGGKKTGLLETAAVPFGLFAIQHLVSRKSRKTKKGKRRLTNKKWKKKMNRKN